MADVITETSVVQVTLLDAAGYAKSLNLDNPKSGLTLNQIREAFQSAIAGRWLYGRSDIVVEVQKATYSQSIKTPIGGGEAVITPNSANITDGTTNPFTFSVEGGTPTAANIINSTVTSSDASHGDWIWLDPVVDSDPVQISGVAYGQVIGHTCVYAGTATLQIWFGASKINIPITVNISIKT